MKRTFQILFVLSISIFLMFSRHSYSQQPVIAGDYKVGDTATCTIKLMDNNTFRVFWLNSKGSSRLVYKEDIDETHEHIWLERIHGKVVGNFIMHENYLSGHYVRFSDSYKAEVVKIQ